jgi:hypothetical protein
MQEVEVLQTPGCFLAPPGLWLSFTSDFGVSLWHRAQEDVRVFPSVTDVPNWREEEGRRKEKAKKFGA